MKFVPTCRPAFFLALLALMTFRTPARGDFSLTVLDVGYGSAVNVVVGFNHVFFDVGPKEASKQLLSYMARAGATSVDIVFLTHAHPDHIGGLLPLQSRYRVGKIFWNDRLPPNEEAVELFDQAEKQSDIQILKPDIKLRLSKHIFLETLPNSLESPNLNDGSLVFLITEGKRRVLITGDIEGPRQNDLAENAAKKIRRPDIFIWPHHGDVLTEAFYSAVEKAGICVISVGENDYGLPKKDALDQAERLCEEIYRTDDLGTLRFIAGKKGVWLNQSKDGSQ